MIMTVQDKVISAASKYNIPQDILLNLAHTESAFNQSAVSPVGAIGVMQLMPATAKWLGVDPNDEDQNIDGGAKYLASLYNQFGSWELAAAAYNAGPGMIKKVLNGVAQLPTETANYIKKIFGIDLMSWLQDQTSNSSGDSGSTSDSTDGSSTPGTVIVVLLAAATLAYLAIKS